MRTPYVQLDIPGIYLLTHSLAYDHISNSERHLRHSILHTGHNIAFHLLRSNLLAMLLVSKRDKS
jgi:hypothetical protein